MYVDIRATYVAQTYLPLLHNFYPYAEQQPNRGHFTKPLLRTLYGLLLHIEETSSGLEIDFLSFIDEPI